MVRAGPAGLFELEICGGEEGIDAGVEIASVGGVRFLGGGGEAGRDEFSAAAVASNRVVVEFDGDG